MAATDVPQPADRPQAVDEPGGPDALAAADSEPDLAARDRSEAGGAFAAEELAAEEAAMDEVDGDARSA